MISNLLWIEPGRRFGFDDLVFWQGRGSEPFAAAASRVRTVVLGPHASAAFPAELRPFVSPRLTRRKQFDYSDVITSSLGRAWATADPTVVFVENPHSRLVLDPNRAAPSRPMPKLREFYARLARSRAGEAGVSFGGVDAIRPITFSGEDVLLEPADEAGWAALERALADCASLGPQPYNAAVEQVIDLVLAAAPQPILVVGLHDTMNTKMRADGAIVVERPLVDRLPAWVNFGNRGDRRGDAIGDESPSLAPARMRDLAAAWAAALGALPGEITLNHPYKGGHEIAAWGRELRVRGNAGSGAVQVEFLREALLGSAATSHLQAPGGDWPAVDEAHIADIAYRLTRAGAQYWEAGK